MENRIARLKNTLSEITIEKAFLMLSLLISTGLVLFFALGFSVVFQYIVGTVFKDRLQVTQNLFTQSLSQDLITGSNHEAYRKCKMFFSESDVMSVKILTSNDNELCALSKTAKNTLEMQSNIYFDDSKTNIAGTINVKYSLDKLYSVYRRIIFATFLLLFVFFALQVIVLKKIGKKVTQPIRTLSDKLKKGNLEDFIGETQKTKIIELDILTDGLRTLSINSLENQKSKILQAEGEAAIQVAKQVSHDIRSPLSALTLLTGGLMELPEDKRILVRNAVARINDIANTLLTKSKAKVIDGEQKLPSSCDSRDAILLSPLIDCLVSEKRIHYREKQNIHIDADISQAYGLFATINATELKRTISNLINNAVEAFPDENGTVTVAVRNYSEKVSIVIQDNGKGVPEQILRKLGQIGVSHGKEGTQSGSGLGVYHAKKTVEDAEGSFQVQSREGTGTTITITFKKAKAPKWFVEKLILSPNMTIASLDDDISIHQIWKGRFESKNISELGIDHLTFTSGVDFKVWLSKQTHQQVKSQRLFLVDYELLNQNATGLDIIEELNLAANAILVTSRYEEHRIRERCERLGVRLIPKAMAGFVPIEITKPKEFFDCILLDDDSLVHSCWQMDAINKNKKFVGFYNADDFFDKAAAYHLETNIYVDSNLGNGIKGEEVSRKIHGLGFTNIYLCTGYQASQFPPMPWLKDIVPKDPQL